MTRKETLLFEEFSSRARAHELIHNTTYSITISEGGGKSLHSTDTNELWKMFRKERIRSKPTLKEMEEDRRYAIADQNDE